MTFKQFFPLFFLICFTRGLCAQDMIIKSTFPSKEEPVRTGAVSYVLLRMQAESFIENETALKILYDVNKEGFLHSDVIWLPELDKGASFNVELEIEFDGALDESIPVVFVTELNGDINNENDTFHTQFVISERTNKDLAVTLNSATQTEWKIGDTAKVILDVKNVGLDDFETNSPFLYEQRFDGDNLGFKTGVYTGTSLKTDETAQVEIDVLITPDVFIEGKFSYCLFLYWGEMEGTKVLHNESYHLDNFLCFRVEILPDPNSIRDFHSIIKGVRYENQRIVLNLELMDLECTATLYNLNGQQLAYHELNGKASKYSFPVTLTNPGLYLLELSSLGKYLGSTKLLVK